MDDPLKNITKMYDKLTYYDQYGGSIILFIIITIVVVILVIYFHIMINAQPIINDWPNQRCKPYIIPVAGLITKPEGVSATEYTAENFNYCTQNILSSTTGVAVQPLTFITSLLQNVANDIEKSIQSIRAMFDKVRTSMQNVSEEIMGRLMNIMTPLIQIIISFKDLIGKIQGTMTAGLFTLLGSYYTLKSLMGAIAQFIISILIALAAMIAMFWAVPFTWGAAIANTAIFVAISIPMIIIMAFMSETLKINTSSYKIPKIKCFDKHTMIKMNSGIYKKICEINVGDVLDDNNIVTSKIKVATEGSIMYFLNNIIVSDSHIVKFGERWIKVEDHPHASKCNKYSEKYLYCLNTTQKIIKINNTIFTDWDELYDVKLNEFLRKTKVSKENIHKYLDCGFATYSKVPLHWTNQLNNLYSNSKEISKIKINDVLENGAKVYGIVEIDGNLLSSQYIYKLSEHVQMEGYSTLLNQTPKTSLKNKHTKLYHLLTDLGNFKIENIIVKDYNYAIDAFIS